MRTVLVTSSLGCGGAERNVTSLANYWSDRGHDVYLITLTAGQPFFPLNDQVIHLTVDSGPPCGLFAFLRRWRQLRSKLVELNPALVISFMDRPNITTALASVGSRFPLIVAERNNPIYHPLPFTWRLLRYISYRRANLIVVQTHQVLRVFQNQYGTDVTVIPNSVNIGESEPQLIDLKQVSRIVAMGRLSHEKGFDQLIDAYSQIAAKHPDVELVIYGSGDEEYTLRNQIDSLGISPQVSLGGTADDSAATLRSGQLFVLPSRSEGFPNVLLEAMALGLPVVSFECDFGPAEIINDGENGILVEPGNTQLLAQQIALLIEDRHLREKLAVNARVSSGAYAIEKIGKMWDEAIEKIK